ncbi:type 1 glutamine amidotransferase [Enterococcus durans]|uniref:Type 1 glutamine amidotransferase n=1 Tax=Enterococcus durans TaxID=53345 RepID=A0A5N0YN34_9ENTE|nr:MULTISPECIES: type 1 glutamine amidotransferase domain-containing protein [Enterococcus]KAA9177456.1 type 1 glutamine amidotransferase [Enterococcus durans]KAA9183979.1 type 1 glutamine amidotransferase [Enterococcus durans]KAA9185143.1 type 1 glutamine amidotransferase [Enterococcus durans]KAA9189282.1 type 1 glutamine amidotransferase [Enterococcus durans]KAA9190923.1 type 1 glutamine amidotransferase [Enterococcus durans]
MTKKVAAIVTDLVEDVELSSPKEALEKAGHLVTLIGFEANQTVKGKKGTEFTIEKSIDEVSPEDFDALLIPGGFSPDQLRADQRFVDFVSYFLKNDQPLFAICHGPQLFIQTGLTKGRTMTAYDTVRPDIGYAGAVVKDEAVVVDKQLVTSRNPDDLPEFDRTIVEILAK